ncbi:MAG: CoA-acylating methylmalonate-semialdehyde dehydrogenase [Treponema sp.]|jgi:malonate-semialdehyde dehydrogenase (acetylating)/methylmalonate-semialdehyde dehydrogenase|nr:CoA-acylating methylmalonate-semialdehyde dehydrogenase [Treponema sp.]
MAIEKLKPFINGKFMESSSGKYMEIYDPSTGEVIAETPCCTTAEVESAVTAARTAFPKWSNTPCPKRVEVLYKFRYLLIQNMDELTYMLCRENGKNWEEAKGDILKVKEPVEVACGAPSLMMGESLMNITQGFDSTLYREPIGVFAGIAPFNFPAMIPMGWMMPMCIAAGNTLVLKAASMTPMTSLRLAALLQEAGLPDGVVNIVTCSRKEAELLLTHPDVKGITFVGSTSIGRHVYTTAAANGKRVQCLCEAKNHALVLADAPVARSAAGIINSAFGCAGERCMALPAIAVEESIADRLVEELVKQVKTKKIGPAYDKTTDLGPVVTADHKKFVLDWIEKGIQEGARLILDGRSITVPGHEKGFYIGHTIFDYVTPEMTVGQSEIFGPVLCVKRVKNFEEGMTLMNANPFANGSVIFTQNGYYAREFAKRTHGGMVGVNVGIPVPAGMFPFAGHKLSFFGDLHCLGKDGLRFYTESKVVTSHWFTEEEAMKTKVSTWDGAL